MKVETFVEQVALVVLMPIAVYKFLRLGQKFYCLLLAPRKTDIKESLERAWAKDF